MKSFFITYTFYMHHSSNEQFLFFYFYDFFYTTRGSYYFIQTLFGASKNMVMYFLKLLSRLNEIMNSDYLLQSDSHAFLFEWDIF